MTTPAQDRDQRAALSAERPQRTEAELEAAARRLLTESGVDADGEDWDSVGDYYQDGTEWEVWLTGDNGWGFEVSGTGNGDGLLAEGEDGYPNALAAAVDLLRHHPELWPEEPAEPEPQPDPLREAAQEALRLLRDGNHGDDGSTHHRCFTCQERWPCPDERAKRRLAAALEDR